MTQFQIETLKRQELENVSNQFEEEVAKMPSWKKWLLSSFIEFLREMLIKLADRLLKNMLENPAK